jgi:ribonuclease D
MSNPRIEIYPEDLSEEAQEYFFRKGLIAIDCEMMGLNISRDRLCLVQIGDEDGNVALIQIALGQREARNLKKLLEAQEVLKVFHYARTDLAYLKFWLDINVQNFFCTKIASKLARTYSDKHSLRELYKEIYGKDMNKTQQSSDWGAPLLNKEQQKYAAGDVQYLIKIYKKLVSMLEREGRMEYALKCIDFIPVMADLDTLGYAEILEH